MTPPFPKLKTSARAQYPATKSVRMQNQVLWFVDGRQQRYRDSAGMLHQWEIRLDQLDESEMAALEQFFAANQGRFGTFAFTDPWDGRVYPNCSFSNDDFTLLSAGEMQGRLSFTVIENR
ncbi:MAG: DUF2460 domain-containing protein [Acidobacteriia bacterium]|nr:DUF2460 domain-containing protein [Terriglobia bacterium]